jgi:hypothetical protein
MANIKISELNSLLTVEDADVLPIVDNAVTKKVTAAILRSYTQGNSVLLTGAQTIAGIKTFTSQLASSVATGTAPFSVASTTKVTNLNADLLDGLSSADFQATLSGTGIVKSTAGTISYLTDNSSNWNTAFNDSIVSAAVTGSATKTLTLNQQDGGTVTASWSDIDTGLTSVGLSMPSAFSVANSPLTSNGTLAVTGAGVASQYVRGDGTLAPFPTSSGGGSSVSYYLNGGTNQGTIGGNTYYEMSKDAVIGVGADFTINSNGYISQFVTDANDPAALTIPAGNWNFEMWFSANSNGGSPSFYLELYKYDGSTLTLISSGSATPELITNGTAINLYTTALAVPTTALTITDRLAVRVFVNNSGKTITLHTQNGHLCQAITTFSTGLTALNGLTNQVQYFATGTSGTDFGISSATSTHTFNLPTASATNRGALSSADWTTFNNKQNAITLTTTGTSGDSTLVGSTLNIPNYGTALANYLPLAGGTLTGALGGTSASFSQGISADVGSAIASIQVKNASTDSPFIGFYRGGTLRNAFQLLTDGSFKLTDASLVANAGLTMGALNGTSANFSLDATINGITAGKGGGSILTNTAFGVSALALNITGIQNTCFGYQAGAKVNSNRVTAFGHQALANITGGGNHIAIGHQAGAFLANGITAFIGGNTSIFIGNNTYPAAESQTNQIVIGNAAIGLGSNTTVLGNSSTLTTAIYGNLLLGTTTDAGFKLNVNGTARVTGAATFSSSVTATGNVSSYGQLRLETSAYGSIVVGSRSSETDFQIYNTGNIFRIYNGTSDALNINTSGNVGIGTTTPNAKLQVQNGTAANTLMQIQSFGTEAAGEYAGIQFKSAASSADEYTKSLLAFRNNGSGYGRGDLYFCLNDATTSANATLSDVKLIIASNGAATFSAGVGISGATGSASGIEFPATQVASASANNLDDYEEGTWTMGIKFGGASVGVTYALNTGTYTKIGRQVTVNGYLALTNKGTSVGNAVITGLPFTIANNLANYSSTNLLFNFLTYLGQTQGFGEINSTDIFLNQITELGVFTSLTNLNFADNTEIIVNFTYFV